MKGRLSMGYLNEAERYDSDVANGIIDAIKRAFDKDEQHTFATAMERAKKSFFYGSFILPSVLAYATFHIISGGDRNDMVIYLLRCVAPYIDLYDLFTGQGHYYAKIGVNGPPIGPFLEREDRDAVNSILKGLRKGKRIKKGLALKLERLNTPVIAEVFRRIALDRKIDGIRCTKKEAGEVLVTLYARTGRGTNNNPGAFLARIVAQYCTKIF